MSEYKHLPVAKPVNAGRKCEAMNGLYPQPGDIILFHRSAYTHAGILDWELNIVHISEVVSWHASECKDDSDLVKASKEVVSAVCNELPKAGGQLVSKTLGETFVVCTPFAEVLGTSRFEIAPLHSTLPAHSPEETVRRAHSQLGRPVQYNLALKNCQHFTNWCKYGASFSTDVSLGATVVSAAAGAVKGAAVGGPFGALAGLAVGATLGLVGSASLQTALGSPSDSFC